MDSIFYYIPLSLWKEIAERFADPTSFGRLRQVNRALKSLLDEESKKKMVQRCTKIFIDHNSRTEVFMIRAYIKYDNGVQFWSKNNKYHRDDDLPAAIYADGSMEWYKEGNLHRDGDLPAIIYPYGEKWWYRHGQFIMKEINTPMY